MASLDRSPTGELLLGNAMPYATLSRHRAAGEIIKLTTGVHVRGGELPVDKLARHHLWAIAEHYWPGAVITDRCADGQPHDGWLFLAHPNPPRRAEVVLPGLTITCRVGPGSQPGDQPYMGRSRLFLAGTARSLVENLATSGRPPKGRPARAGGAVDVGSRIDSLARRGGELRVRHALAELDVIAGAFEPAHVAEVRRLLRAVLGTIPGGHVASPLLAARLAGHPYDEHRVTLFRALAATLRRTAPAVRPALGGPSRWEWLPFFEAYFSNYIEGTVFSIDEAREIAIDGKIPPTRPQDAHDVSATYRLVSSEREMKRVPVNAEELSELLVERHSLLMAGRPDKRPGQFKEVANSAGGYEFVHPDAVQGTLSSGFDVLSELTDPFHRAVMMMFLIAECHPFDDGNGRMARIMMNAELASAGQVRVVIPSVYRGNYLAALSGMSNQAGAGESLISSLDYTRQWVAWVDWSDWSSARRDLEASNAILDSAIAEQSGQRLRIP